MKCLTLVPCSQAFSSTRPPPLVFPRRDRAARRHPPRLWTSGTSRRLWRPRFPLLRQLREQPSGAIFRRRDPIVQQPAGARWTKPECWGWQPVRASHNLWQLGPNVQQHQQHHQVKPLKEPIWLNFDQLTNSNCAQTAKHWKERLREAGGQLQPWQQVGVKQRSSFDKLRKYILKSFIRDLEFQSQKQNLAKSIWYKNCKKKLFHAGGWRLATHIRATTAWCPAHSMSAISSRGDPRDCQSYLSIYLPIYLCDCDRW